MLNPPLLQVGKVTLEITRRDAATYNMDDL